MPKEEVNDAGLQTEGWEAPRRQERQGNRFSPRTSKRKTAPRHLDFSPLTPTLDSDLHHVRK